MRKRMVNQLYGQALRDFPGLGTPTEAAQRTLAKAPSPRGAADRLRRRYTLYCGMTGFVCGLPGYAAVPVTVPTNVAGVLLLQLHMCAAISVLAGLDPEDEEVRRWVVACVLDTTEDEDDDRTASGGLTGFLKRVGVKVGERAVRFTSEQALRWVGRRSRSLPLVGGVIGGYSDVHSTRRIGREATERFLSSQSQEEE